MMKKLIGTVSFTASGNELYPFINSIRENNITCMSQRCHAGVFRGCIYLPDMNSLSQIAQQYGISVEFHEKKGLPVRLFRYRFRFGIIIGIFLVCAFVFYLSNIVVSIEVCGNNAVSREQIIFALAETGIYKGRFIADIDFRKCEQRLKLSIPEISWTGIRHTGSRIVVDVTEVVHGPEMIRDNIPCNVVADRDAQIISLEVYAGRKLIKSGSTVKKGSIIISGIINDGGGHTLKKHASGKIIGRYNESVTFSQRFSDEAKVYTENETTKKYFEFFGHRIPLFFKKADFESFDSTETANSLMLFGKQLPLGIVHISYAPFEYKTRSYSSDEVNILLEQQMSAYEKNLYDSKNIKIEKRSIKKNIFNDRIEHIVTYTLSGQIGEDREIFVDR